MPASFVRLRIAGFKSFAEPVVLELLPGLTGIVGPNGCGKSNVVEALRWAMGETSARSLRGAEMDDVIFGGTAHRPRRDLAEVTLWLDETRGLAPPPFAAEPALQISRRIARGEGSVFRVNTREVRARDVQTLYADLATGARASAMISQGRVAAVVAASPAERRGILEEAAGISGLHARRHEAELKLRAAEANLARAHDLQEQLAGQIEGLRRQAKHAARFRSIGEALATARAELLAFELAAATDCLAATQAARDVALADSDAARRAVALADADAAAASDTVPSLRSAEALARTELDRARLAGEQAAKAAAEASGALAAAQARAAQVAGDLAHANGIARDAEAAATRLALEADSLDAASQEHPARLAQAEADLEQASMGLASAEAETQAAVERSADLLARHRAASEAQSVANARAGRAAASLAALARDLAQAKAACVPEARVASLADERARAEAAVRAADAAIEQADAAHSEIQAALQLARARAGTAECSRLRLAATIQGLAEILVVDAARGGIINSLSVPEGLEAAFAAGLGDDLDAGVDPGSPRHWRSLPPLAAPDWPDGVTALTGLVSAPPALARAVGRIGLIDGAAAPDSVILNAALGPGQTLVSRDGAAWRWDGFTVRPDAPRPAAIRLQQRNRLASLRTALHEAEAEAETARKVVAATEAAARDRHSREQELRAARRTAAQTAQRLHTQHAELAARALAALERARALELRHEQAASERDESLRRQTESRTALMTLGDPQGARAQTATARDALVAARRAEQAARQLCQSLERTEAARAQRRAVLAVEREDWAMRASDAAGRVVDLRARSTEAIALVSALEDAPAAATSLISEAGARLCEAELAHKVCADQLARSEAAHVAAASRLRSAEHAWGAAREAVIRAEAAAQQAHEVHVAVLLRVGEIFSLPAVPSGPDAGERIRRRLDRLEREQAEMGPVNLRAELETAKIETQAETMARETTEIETAIARLRGTIGHINREGRERVGQVFADIDRHFRSLFERMFGGGRAHLALVGSDDPLQAGLEIFAQPPGKKLAALSLLSGGEQALAALSLIFAVFRCQPAPICVLDEVDAPLDDANVGRFCALLGEMAREGGTRFLVVTHHQLTMARMDRLYGVTMQERGVSRLLSVDLERAVAFGEQAIAAE